MKKGRKFTRRDFLKLMKMSSIDLALLALGGAAYGYLVEPGWVRVESLTLKLPRLFPEFSGIRIAQISDIHMGGWMNAERLKHIVDLVIDKKPELLLLTGDFLIGHTYDDDAVVHLREIAEVLTPLTNSIPAFGILGNHDYWTNSEAVRGTLRDCNVIELTNSVHTISRGDKTLHLCGIDDVWMGNVRLDIVLDSLPDDGAAILLAHEPDFADESASTNRFDLQVSGHTHGGQIVIPFLGPPILPYLGRKYPAGLYKIGDMYQYTNRGVGMARLPIRINCPPEVTIFTLESPA